MPKEHVHLFCRSVNSVWCEHHIMTMYVLQKLRNISRSLGVGVTAGSGRGGVENSEVVTCTSRTLTDVLRNDGYQEKWCPNALL